MSLDLEVHLQVWKELKPHLAGGDLDAAAEDFVHVLLEHGINANDILEFSVDSHIKSALRGIADEENFDDDDEDDEYLDFDDERGC